MHALEDTSELTALIEGARWDAAYGKLEIIIGELEQLGEAAAAKGLPQIPGLKQWAFGTLRCLERDGDVEADAEGKALAERAKRLIDSRLDRELSVASLADALRVSSGYLSKAFKAHAGIRLSDYLIDRRLEAAAAMLRSSDERIYRIAEKVGYGTTSHFIKVFKRRYRLTPDQYRSVCRDPRRHP